MKISVIIPNYNGSNLLKKNLPQILDATSGNEVIVIDDASTDDSVGMLKKYFPQVKIITRRKNEGFASTVNDGVDNASGDLILLLNSDAVPEKNFLKYLTVHFNNPQVFAVGCLQYSTHDKDKAVHGRGIGKFEKGFLMHGTGGINKKDTLWVFGGAGMFRRKLWDKLGGMDTVYNPFYWEDIDLSYRALKAGFKLIFEPKSVVIHHQDEGAIRSSYKPEFINTITYRNQLFFVWLNITDPGFMVEHFIYLPIHLFNSLLKADFAFLKGFLQAVSQLPQVLSHRSQNQKRSKISDRMVLDSFSG